MQISSLPALFISHGAPDLVLEDGPDVENLRALGRHFSSPRAVVVVSAHWTTRSLIVNQTPTPPTWHDFSGFAPALYNLQYPARTDTALAEELPIRLREAGVQCDVTLDRPFDHGAWVPLMLMYPEANIPVVTLSLPLGLGAAGLMALGAALAPLRQQNVLILASGSYTHNLWALDHDHAPTPDWCQNFANWADSQLLSCQYDELVDWESQAPHAKQNHPSPEHFLPLFVALGTATPGQVPVKLYDNWRYGSLSMACWRFD
jgi:4,5-DOPA dioxygenase extradiol